MYPQDREAEVEKANIVYGAEGGAAGNNDDEDNGGGIRTVTPGQRVHTHYALFRP